MSDQQELASSASSNNRSLQQQHSLSDAEKATRAPSREAGQLEEKEEQCRQLMGIKIRPGLDLVTATSNPSVDHL